MFGDQERLIEQFNHSFETDDAGQVFYAPLGFSNKMAITEDEYEKAISKYRQGLSISMLFLVITFVGVSIWIMIQFLRGTFGASDAAWILVPIVGFLAISAYTVHSSVGPLQIKMRQYLQSTSGLEVGADLSRLPKPMTLPQKVLARVCGALLALLGVFYLLQ